MCSREEGREVASPSLREAVKKEVLRRQKDFDRLYKKGRSFGSKHLVLIYRPNGLAYNRLAFLASKKVGNSVRRNRARRLMKESFRLYSGNIPEGFDILFIARASIGESKRQDVQRSLASVLKKSGLPS
jgi:ribonuclease P protein component